MAEEVVLMKGNEAIAHAAIRFGVDGYFGYLSPLNPKCWKRLPNRSHGKQPVWLSFRQKVKSQLSTWYTEGLLPVRWS